MTPRWPLVPFTIAIVFAAGALPAQAQDYPAAIWGIGLRANRLSASEVERAFDQAALDKVLGYAAKRGGRNRVMVAAEKPDKP